MIEFVSCKRFWWWCSSFLHWRVKHRNESLPLLAPVFFRFRRLYWRRESFPSLCLSFFLIFFLFLFSFLLSYFLNGYIIYWCINVSSAEIRLEKKNWYVASFYGIYIVFCILFFLYFFIDVWFPVAPEVLPFWKQEAVSHSTPCPHPTLLCLTWPVSFLMQLN